MKLGLLLCDQVKEPLASIHGQYPAMFARLLLQADPTLIFPVYNAEREELPKHIDAADAYLITGSRHGVLDGYRWITKLEEFLLQLHHAEKKVVGICFGHQLLAKVLGGQVDKAPQGWGIGVSQNQITRQQPWMTPGKNSLHLPVSHQDQVITPPLEAEILAGSAFCPFYMMQIGHHLMTVQGHPEFSTSYTRALIETRRDILGPKLAEESVKSLQLPVDNKLFAHWIVNFLREPGLN
ncbi:glutamine amidotransferase-related protein [Legionella spiritensis]|uniref:Glutamine amidotransferase, class I n=1 Tax=Legionella spiritensis TaxID=452 RepID=A0A0W0YWC4_LEGSP|nr:glutamine amidotransferase [Legionella spiritensis]KTD61140.1 glutamine amidotransferase, class I [Legionella spiritensis]SNV45159.1 glutamine amidotransferase, class I [Legionella spiritensis]